MKPVKDGQFDLIGINYEQRLYVLKCGDGVSCYGFDVVTKKTNRLAKEMQEPIFDLHETGTPEHYYTYCILVHKAQLKNSTTGWRSQSELNPKLIGMEGKRIEATVYGERIRFYVGRSTGWIPCHLLIKSKRSHGGESLPADPEEIQDIKILK